MWGVEKGEDKAEYTKTPVPFTRSPLLLHTSADGETQKQYLVGHSRSTRCLSTLAGYP